MKLLCVIFIAGMACTGCALFHGPAKVTLDQADAKLTAADYAGAQVLYAAFVNADPGNSQAPRARAMQTVLDRLLSTESELDRIKKSDEAPRHEAPRLRREVGERTGEVDRLKGEVVKLRAALERLRTIDLETLPGTKR
jgi:hypothetical protein